MSEEMKGFTGVLAFFIGLAAIPVVRFLASLADLYLKKKRRDWDIKEREEP